jgi:hypothetical protein
MVFMLCLIGSASAVVKIEAAVDHQTQLVLEDIAPGLTLEQVAQMTPRQIREVTGRKMSFKETVVLKQAQKQLRKSMDSGNAASGNPKSQLIALLLVIFLGGLGIHRFYLGYTTIGIIQLLTAGGCGVWALIDLIRIITGDLKPADGSNYDPTL